MKILFASFFYCSCRQLLLELALRRSDVEALVAGAPLVASAMRSAGLLPASVNAHPDVSQARSTRKISL
jgi:hypothetical protein